MEKSSIFSWNWDVENCLNLRVRDGDGEKERERKKEEKEMEYYPQGLCGVKRFIPYALNIAVIQARDPFWTEQSYSGRSNYFLEKKYKFQVDSLLVLGSVEES